MKFKKEWQEYFREPGIAACLVGSVASITELVTNRMSGLPLLIMLMGVTLLLFWELYIDTQQSKIQETDMWRMHQDIATINNIVSGVLSKDTYFIPYEPEKSFESDSPFTTLAAFSNAVAWATLSVYLCIDMMTTGVNIFSILFVIVYCLNSFNCVKTYFRRIKKMRAKTKVYRGVVLTYDLSVSIYNEIREKQN